MRRFLRGIVVNYRLLQQFDELESSSEREIGRYPQHSGDVRIALFVRKIFERVFSEFFACGIEREVKSYAFADDTDLRDRLTSEIISGAFLADTLVYLFLCKQCFLDSVNSRFFVSSRAIALRSFRIKRSKRMLLINSPAMVAKAIATKLIKPAITILAMVTEKCR